MNRILIKFLTTSAAYFALDNAYAIDMTTANAEARIPAVQASANRCCSRASRERDLP